MVEQTNKLDLEIVDIIDTATNTRVYVFDGKNQSMSYQNGQFVKLYFDPQTVMNYGQQRLAKGEITNEIMERIKIRSQHNFREFSICNPNTRPGYIELLVEKEAEGSFSPWFVDNVKIGDKVDVEGPFGRFILDENNKNVCFLAAGSGIAPLMCMIRYIVDKELDGKYVLIYSNKNRQHISYRKELEEIDIIKKNFWFFNTLTRLTDHEKNTWTGYSRRMDADMIKECLTRAGIKLNDCYFYLCGGPPFLKGMTNPASRMNLNEPKGALDLMEILKDKVKMEIY